MEIAKTRVVLSGAAGKMGRMIAHDFLTTRNVELAGAVDVGNIGEDIGVLSGLPESGITVSPTLDVALADGGADVWLDFSTLEAALHNIPAALMAGLNCLVGVTGFTDGDILKLRIYQEKSGNVLWIVPNFSLGVNLMLEFARKAKSLFPDCEIVEMHHDTKRDAPSGTALKTARDLDAIRPTEKMASCKDPSRGLGIGGVAVHSIRLPGLLAHQEILFGGRGELLTIRHDAMSRECFLPGIYLALEKISGMGGYVFGMEKVI